MKTFAKIILIVSTYICQITTSSNRLETDPSKAEVVKALSLEWRAISEREKRDYPPEGKTGEKRSLGDSIPERDEVWKRKRLALWESLKDIVGFSLLLLMK